MQNNFEYIFKLIVALAFLMCVVCSQYQYSFFNVLHYIIIFIFFFSSFLFYFLERKTAKRKKKERNKENKVKSQIKFSIWKPFDPIIFSA